MDINHNLFIAVGIAIFLAVIGFLMRSKFVKQGRRRMKVELVEAKKLTHDTIIFTFTLPNTSKSLGLKVGEHI